MNKQKFLVGLVVMMMFLIAACGGGEGDSSSDNNSSDNSSENKDDKQEKQAEFKDVETLSVGSSVITQNFSFNEAGDILFWTEFEDREDGSRASNVWVNGEVKDIDIDKYGNIALLSSGIIVTAHADLKAPADKMHTIIEYDPTTDSEETYLIEGDAGDTLLHPGFGTYLDDSKTYIHTITRPEDGGPDTFLLDVESSTFTDLTIIQDIIQEAGGEELASYPHFTLSEDASIIYASVLHLGAFAYDVEKQELETLLLDDGFVDGGGNTPMLTADGKYFAYAMESSTSSDISATFHLIDLETKETIDISTGRKLFTLTDGNVIVVDEDDVKKFDVETEELTTIFTLSLEEGQNLDDITVSPDGNTIAYGYTEKEGDEKRSFIKILSNN